MKIHEYQAKQLLQKAGVAVLQNVVATTPDEAAKARSSLDGSAQSGRSISVRAFSAGPQKRGPENKPDTSAANDRTLAVAELARDTLSAPVTLRELGYN